MALSRHIVRDPACHGGGPGTGADAFDSALQIDRENPFSVNTDWGMSAGFESCKKEAQTLAHSARPQSVL